MVIALSDLGDFDAALAELEVIAAGLGNDGSADEEKHLYVSNGQANVLTKAGRGLEAVPVAEQTVEAAKHRYGPTSAVTMSFCETLGYAYQTVGRTHEAIELLEPAMSHHLSNRGPMHPATIITQEHLAACYRSDSRLTEAAALLRQVVDHRTHLFGADHRQTVSARNALSEVTAPR
jgi:tetratricopeptide (TPR) repeat protein